MNDRSLRVLAATDAAFIPAKCGTECSTASKVSVDCSRKTELDTSFTERNGIPLAADTWAIAEASNFLRL
jgi:hypothetical protein